MWVNKKNSLIESHSYQNEHGVRIEEFARNAIETIQSNKGIKKAIKKGLIKVNKQEISTAYFMQRNDLLELYSDTEDLQFFEEEIEIIYEDDYFAVVNKPAGMSVHSHGHRNLVNALPFNLYKPNIKDVLFRPYPIHRLDQVTSGLILVAKTKSAQLKMSEDIKERKIEKTYTAIVHNETPNHGSIKEPIEGKKSLSEYIKEKNFGNSTHFSLLKLKAITGRTHQLRIHLSGIDHPIVGDRLYSNEGTLIKGRGLMLCASEINLMHPISNEEMHFQIDPPKKFEKFIQTKNFD